MRKFFLCLPFLFVAPGSYSQNELACTVTILDNQIQVTDKSPIRRLEQALANFMNNNKWSTEKFEPNERIEINVQIILTTYNPLGKYSGSAQIQSRRPIYGTAYNSIAFNINDENWDFSYTDQTQLTQSDNSYSSEIVALMSFYAYYIIGIDFDSYGMLGGTPYFNKAFGIANMAQSGGLSGWQPNERNIRSRFNLADNIVNERFKPMREANYMYHRKGLDLMAKDPETGRKNIYSALELVQKVYKIAPNTVMLNVFFESKSDELVNIFKGAPENEKPKVISLLNEINLPNTTKYEKIRN